MRAGLRHLYVVAVVLLLALATTSKAEEGVEASEVTSYYGRLDLPPAYFNHPDSDAPINRLQPGAVVLHNSHTTITVPVQKDGSFVVYNLPYGTYLLQADYHDFHFPTVRVDVQYKERAVAGEDGSASEKKIRIPSIRSSSNDFPVKPLRGSGVDEESPAVIPALGIHEYYIPRGEFRVTDLLKNPMILMMLVSFGLMGMMKLFPEEELKESQRMSKEWQKKLFNKATGAEEEETTTASIDKKKN